MREKKCIPHPCARLFLQTVVCSMSSHAQKSASDAIADGLRLTLVIQTQKCIAQVTMHPKNCLQHVKQKRDAFYIGGEREEKKYISSLLGCITVHSSSSRYSPGPLLPVETASDLMSRARQLIRHSWPLAEEPRRRAAMRCGKMSPPPPP
jgi:hypothetical protein